MAFEINDWIKDILNHLNDINNSELTKGTVAYALKAKGGWEKWLQITSYIRSYKYFKKKNCVNIEEGVYDDGKKRADFVICDMNEFHKGGVTYHSRIINIELKCMTYGGKGFTDDRTSLVKEVNKDVEKIDGSGLHENYVMFFFRAHEGTELSYDKTIEYLDNEIKGIRLGCGKQPLLDYGAKLDDIDNGNFNLVLGCAAYFVQHIVK